MRTNNKHIFWVIAALTLGLLLCAIIALAVINEFTLRITLTGPREMNVEYGTIYKEPGVSADVSGKLFVKKPVPLKIQTRGAVNNRELGTYEICYTAKCGWYKQEQKRIVHVVDTTAPVITLKHDPSYFTRPGEAYREEGYSAVDNRDGDVTQKVQRVEKDGVIVYTVTDAEGNTATAERPVFYHDPVAPELTLKGSDVELYVGQAYLEPGFSATDNCDGDITRNVEITGGVNVYAAGVYTLTYSVVDSYGNTATVSRQVTVKPRTHAQGQPVAGKVIYLTFDDGPGPYTGELLDVLQRYGVKATFFVVNTGYIGMIQRAAAEGHTVAVHTATHRFNDIYASEEAFFDDFERMQSVIESYTGQKPMILRFPGGSSNTISNFNKGIMTRLVKSVKDYGLRYFDWNVDSGDAGGARTTWEVFQNVVNGIGSKQVAVVLQHDTLGYSVDAVEQIILWGIENGYTFAPLTMESPACEHPVFN